MKGLYLHILNNERYCVYDEIYVSIKDDNGVDLPQSERGQFCLDEFGEDAKEKGVDSTNKYFICEVSNTKTAKQPTKVCAQNEKYRLLEDGLSFVCYEETNVDAEPATLYCPEGYVKNSCTNTHCTCSRTVTVKAYEK